LTISACSAAAEADPRGFIAGLPQPATIDEIQRAPRLLLAIKETVDRQRSPGAFIVTGSSRLDTLRGLRESLAGRMALLTLRPMTVLELAHKPDLCPVDRLFECKDAPAAAQHFAKVTPARISQEMFLAGGFPEPALHLNGAGRRAWFREYRKSYIERDVPAILRIEEVPALVRFLDACAATTAQLLNITELARDTGVSVDTARRWLGLLEATFIAERRSPYWRNIRKRLVKSPKIFLCDSGLAASLTGVEKWPSGADRTPAGHILETWVLAALAELAESPAELHFYRTHSQEEVDFVLVRSGELIGIEVKHGATVGRSDADGIESLKEQFPKVFRFGLVLYLGESVIPLSVHAVAVPLSAFFGS